MNINKGRTVRQYLCFADERAVAGAGPVQHLCGGQQWPGGTRGPLGGACGAANHASKDTGQPGRRGTDLDNYHSCDRGTSVLGGHRFW